MALYFLAVYLASKGMSDARAGLVVSAYGLGALIAAPAGGYLSNRLSPLAVMKAALLLQGLILLTFLTAGSFASYLCLTLVWALAGEPFRPASMALIARMADATQRRMALALNRVAANVGTAVGPALGCVFIQTRPSSIFVVNSAASIAAAALLASSLRGKRLEAAADEAACRDSRHVDTRESPVTRDALLVILALIPAFAVFYQYRSTMSQYILDRQILGPHLYGLLLPINAVLVIAVNVPLNVCLRRWPEKFGMSLGAFLIGAGFGGFALTGTFPGVLACVVVWTLGQVTLFSSSDCYVSRVAGEQGGRYVGLYHAAVSFAAFVGPGCGSLLLGYGTFILWGLMFAWGCLTAILILCLAKR